MNELYLDKCGRLFYISVLIQEKTKRKILIVTADILEPLLVVNMPNKGKYTHIQQIYVHTYI